MTKALQSLIFLLITGYVATVFTACENQEPAASAEINCFFTAAPVSVLNGKVMVENAHLQVARIDITGDRDEERLSFSKTLSDQEGAFVLVGTDPRQPVKVSVDPGRYRNVKIDLSLYQDSYTLILRDTVYGNSGGGNGDGDHDGDDEDDDEDEDDGDDDDGDRDDDGKDHDHNDDCNHNDDDGDDDDDDDGRKGRHGKTVDLLDFLQHAKPSILLIATYENQHASFKILMAVDDLHHLTLPAHSHTSDSVVLDKNAIVTATANFNLRSWFQHIGPKDLEAADIITFRGNNVLFLHKDFNGALFRQLAARIQGSTELLLTAHTRE